MASVRDDRAGLLWRVALASATTYARCFAVGDSISPFAVEMEKSANRLTLSGARKSKTFFVVM